MRLQCREVVLVAGHLVSVSVLPRAIPGECLQYRVAGKCLQCREVVLVAGHLVSVSVLPPFLPGRYLRAAVSPAHSAACRTRARARLGLQMGWV